LLSWKAATLNDAPEPLFEAIFDEMAFPAADGSTLLDGDDLAGVFGEEEDGTVGTHVDGAARPPRFDGDTGELPAEVSWALQALVAAPHVSEQATKHWAAVLQYEKVLRSRLSELGLVLEINREHGYAFTCQADDPSPHSRAILRTKTLSLAASTLCLYLYNQYVVAPDAPVIENADMEEHMLAYRRPDDTDDAAFQKKIRTAIKSLEDAAIIKPVKGTSRYIIYGVITSILTAERVEALGARYRAIIDGDQPAPSDEHMTIDPISAAPEKTEKEDEDA
jgi:hypothetical protein